MPAWTREGDMGRHWRDQAEDDEAPWWAPLVAWIFAMFGFGVAIALMVLSLRP